MRTKRWGMRILGSLTICTSQSSSQYREKLRSSTSANSWIISGGELETPIAWIHCVYTMKKRSPEKLGLFQRFDVWSREKAVFSFQFALPPALVRFVVNVDNVTGVNREFIVLRKNEKWQSWWRFVPFVCRKNLRDTLYIKIPGWRRSGTVRPTGRPCWSYRPCQTRRPFLPWCPEIPDSLCFQARRAVSLVEEWKMTGNRGEGLMRQRERLMPQIGRGETKGKRSARSTYHHCCNL